MSNDTPFLASVERQRQADADGALDLLNDLALHGGAIVSIARCSAEDQRAASAQGRLLVLSTGLGFLRQPADWITKQELDRGEAQSKIAEITHNDRVANETQRHIITSLRTELDQRDTEVRLLKELESSLTRQIADLRLLADTRLGQVTGLQGELGRVRQVVHAALDRLGAPQGNLDERIAWLVQPRDGEVIDAENVDDQELAQGGYAAFTVRDLLVAADSLRAVFSELELEARGHVAFAFRQ